MIKYISILATLLFMSACTPDPQLPDLPPGAQAISFTGDTLMKPEIYPGQIQALENDLKDAAEVYRKDPEDPEAIIWLGRRSAYLGEYRDAVKIFTEGIYKHPENPEMYRHRGHRYITLRMPDKAIEDLLNAVSMIRDTDDKTEEDGIPNPINEPRTTLQFNIWYHLGLAYYIKGDFKSAADAYAKCLEVSTNDDMLVATLYWYYMALRRAGLDEEAGDLLDRISEEMDIIENHSYHQLLLVFKGIFTPDSLLGSSEDIVQNATIGYGIGNWHFINDRKNRAFTIWNRVLRSGTWPAFGYIAAEAEL